MRLIPEVDQDCVRCGLTNWRMRSAISAAWPDGLLASLFGHIGAVGDLRAA